MGRVVKRKRAEKAGARKQDLRRTAIVIIGPTSSGKSKTAVELALWLEKNTQKKRFQIEGAEIISADSRQVYKGLDLTSGKITKEEMKGVSHHLLGVTSLKKTFTVHDYQKIARKTINDIINRNKVPIICGGTGLYIDALIKGFQLPEVSPNKALRDKLGKLSTEELFRILKIKDRERAAKIDNNNRVRLIRAIEVATALGQVPRLKPVPLPYQVIYFGIRRLNEELREVIKKRLTTRLKLGMVREVNSLHKKGVSWKRLEQLGLECRCLAYFLQKKISHDEMIRLISKETWKYVKRQMTWFKKNNEINWISGLEDIKNRFIDAP